MCDPLSIGMAALSAAGSIGGAMMQASATQDVMNKQNDANAQWVAYQESIHRQEALAQDQARNQANAARVDTLGKISPQSQEATQAAEAERLNTAYETSGGPGRAAPGVAPGTNPATTAPYALTKEGTGTSGVGEQNPAFMQDLSSQINAATGQARQRVAALATANSYGGSFGGLGTTVPIALQQGANQINLQNEIRKSDLQTYGVEQQVQPLHYTFGPNYGIAGSIANTLASVAGRGAGAGLSKGFSGGFGGGGADTTGTWDTGMGFTSDVPPETLGTAANPLPGLTAADYGY